MSNVSASIPVLTLVNKSLDIHLTGINGGIIGRKQGPYKNIFEKNPYVSGVHAQLSYNNQTGWCIIDKHSSNGTLLNQRRLHPDEMMSLRNGDIVTIANKYITLSKKGKTWWACCPFHFEKTATLHGRIQAGKRPWPSVQALGGNL